MEGEFGAPGKDDPRGGTVYLFFGCNLTMCGFVFLDKRHLVPDFKLIKPKRFETKYDYNGAAYSLAKIKGNSLTN
jgi:hypothetical protein